MDVGTGIGLASNLVSSAIYDLIKKICGVCHAALKCDGQCHILELLLQRMGPRVEVVEKLLSRLLELDPKDRLIITGSQDWLDKLKTQFDVAHETVDKCLQISGWNLCALLKKSSLSGKLTELAKNIESLDSEMALYTLLLQIMCLLLKEKKSQGFLEAPLHAWNTSDGSQQGYPVIASQIGYPANGTQLGYPASAREPLYPAIASQPRYPAIASQSSYPGSASQQHYPEIAGQPFSPAIARQPLPPAIARQSLYPEIARHDRFLFRHQYGTVGPVPEDKHVQKEAEYKSVEDVKVPAAKPEASYVMEPKPHGENDKKEKWHDGVAEEEKKSRQPFKRLRDKVRRTFHSNKGS